MTIQSNDRTGPDDPTAHQAFADGSGPQPDAFVCDLGPVSVVRVRGPDAAAFLQGQLTNNIMALEVGSSQYSAWCSPKGRMLANFVAMRVDAATFELLLDASLADTIRKRLAMFILRSKVTIEDASDASVRLGIGGAGANAALQRSIGRVPPLHRSVALEGATVFCLPGPRYLVIAALQAAHSLRQRLVTAARPDDFQRWQWLTIRAGVPVITTATTDAFVPQTANWDLLGGVNFQKGCYAGQEIVARTQYLGRLKERLFLAHVETAEIAAGDRLFSTAFAGQASGTVVNAAPAPSGGTDLLAVVQIAAWSSGDIRLGAADGPAATLLALPYALPEPAAPRGRIA